MNVRKGITLTEVLVTIFVMAIGLLAILALFPLAALNMAQAIQDDRVGHSAGNAEAIANMYMDFRPVNDSPSNVNGKPGTATSFLGGSVQDDGPSAPIYIDPYGYQGGTYTTISGTSIKRMDRPWANTGTVSPRVPPDGGPLAQFLGQTFVLQDDLIFDIDGTARGSSNSNKTGNLQRESRYSWAYMIRRPRAMTAGVVDVQVVVYSQRSTFVSGTSAGAAPGETVVSGVSGATAGGTSMIIPPQTGVGLRKGIWLLDATDETDVTKVKQFGPVHAFFYRVSNVTQTSSGMQLEVQPPLKADISKIVIMEKVVDVFDKGAGWQEPLNRPDE